MTVGGEIVGRRAPRFPIGLTLGAVVVFVVCCGLGVWQLQRGAWKAHELVRIAELKHAPPAPIALLFPRMQRGEDLTFAHAIADCEPGPAAPAQFHMISDNGEWIARTLSACRQIGRASCRERV